MLSGVITSVSRLGSSTRDDLLQTRLLAPSCSQNTRGQTTKWVTGERVAFCKVEVSLSEILGAIGVTLLVVAFVLNATGKLRVSYIYTTLNLVGAGMAAAASYLIDYLPFVILESVWFLAAFVKLMSLLRNRPRSDQVSLSHLGSHRAMDE